MSRKAPMTKAPMTTKSLVKKRTDAKVGLQRKALVVQNTEGKLLSKDLVLEMAKVGRIRSAKDPERVMRFIASTERVDRMGDIIRQEWELKSYQSNPVILWDHDQGRNIGRSLGEEIVTEGPEAERVGKHLAIYVEFMPPEIDEFSDKVFKMYKDGWLKGGSVGYVPMEIDDVLDEEQRKSLGLGPIGVVFRKSELAEFSLCTVPANQEALATEMKSAPTEVLDTMKELMAASPNAAWTVTMERKTPVAKKDIRDDADGYDYADNDLQPHVRVDIEGIDTEWLDSEAEKFGGENDGSGGSSESSYVFDTMEDAKGFMDAIEDSVGSGSMSLRDKNGEEIDPNAIQRSAKPKTKTPRLPRKSPPAEPIAGEPAAEETTDPVHDLIEQLETLLSKSQDPCCKDALSLLEDLEVALGLEETGDPQSAAPQGGAGEENIRPTLAASAKGTKEKTVQTKFNRDAVDTALDEVVRGLPEDQADIAEDLVEFVSNEEWEQVLDILEAVSMTDTELYALATAAKQEVFNAASARMKSARLLAKGRSGETPSQQEFSHELGRASKAVEELWNMFDQGGGGESSSMPQVLDTLSGATESMIECMATWDDDGGKSASVRQKAADVRRKANTRDEANQEDAATLVSMLREIGMDDDADTLEGGDLLGAFRSFCGWFTDSKGNTGDPIGDEEWEVIDLFERLTNESFEDTVNRMNEEEKSASVRKSVQSSAVNMQYDALLQDMRRTNKALERVAKHGTSVNDRQYDRQNGSQYDVAPSRPVALRSAQRRRR